MPTGTIGRDDTAHTSGSISTSEFDATLDRDDTGRVSAALTVNQPGERP